MKAQELRIGNYISIGKDNNIVRVDGMYLNGFAFELTLSNDKGIFVAWVKNCDPIPLTEDWLLKFGFEKEVIWRKSTYGNLWEQDSRSLELSEFGLGGQYETFYRNIGSNPNHDYTKLGFIIRYVHQLQNLYFALTGEELTIKE